MTRRVFATMMVLSTVLSLSVSYLRGLVAAGCTGVCPTGSPWAPSAGIIAAAEVQQARYALPLSKAFERPGLLGWWAEKVTYRHEIEDGLEEYPNVEQAIRDSGLAPLAFIWTIIQIESSGNPEAVNPGSQAAGLMQVMPHTSGVPTEDLLTPGVGIAEGVHDLNNKLASNDGDLYEAMFDFSGGPRQTFQGRMVGWASKESFDQAYWQRLLSAYEDLTGTRATTEPIEQIAQASTPPAEQAPAPEWAEELTRLRAILTAEPPEALGEGTNIGIGIPLNCSREELPWGLLCHPICAILGCDYRLHPRRRLRGAKVVAQRPLGGGHASLRDEHVDRSKR